MTLLIPSNREALHLSIHFTPDLSSGKDRRNALATILQMSDDMLGSLAAFAISIFDLNGGVTDLEMLMQFFANLMKKTIVGRRL